MTTVEAGTVARAAGEDRLWWTTHGWVIDAAVGLVTLVIALVFLSEPLPVDPMIYMDTAMDPAGSVVDHRGSRLGVVIPTWLVGLVFDHSEVTFYALPILTFVLLAVAISNLGRAMFGWWVGPLAALLTVCSPFVFIHATQLLPDIPATAVSTASLAVLYHATRRHPDKRTVLLVVAGALFGIAFLMRETAVLFLPGLIAVALLWGARWRGVAMLLAGSLVGPLLDFIGNTVLWGDPLTRVSLIFMRSSSGREISEEAAEAAFLAQSNVFKSLSLLSEALWDSSIGRAVAIGVVAYLVVICLPGFRNRDNWALPAWVLSTWVIFAAVATMRPESGTPVLRLNQVRYWTPFAPALVLMAVGWIQLVTSRLVSPLARRLPAVIASLLAGVLVFVAISDSLMAYPDHFSRFGGDAYLQLRDEFREMPVGSRVNVPDGVDTLVQIYANDIVGRPINDIEVLVANEVPVDPSGWYLFHPRGIRPLAPSGETLPWPTQDHEVAAAHEALRWVLHAPRAASEGEKETVLELATPESEVGWQGRRIIPGGTWDPPAPFSGELDLDGDQDLVIYDDSAALGVAGPDAVAVEAGALVSLVVEVAVEEGAVDGICQFISLENPDEYVNLEATSMVYRSPYSGTREWLCWAPDDLTGPMTVRPMIAFRTPAVGEVGGASVVAHHVVD